MTFAVGRLDVAMPSLYKAEAGAFSSASAKAKGTYCRARAHTRACQAKHF